MPSKNNWVFWVGVIMALSMSFGQEPFADDPSENSITIVYNNIPGKTSARVQVGGGFSAFIMFDQHKILFDPGGDAAILIGNVRALELDLEKLDVVVISHNHWDHVYGLPALFYLAETVPKVYVPGSSRESVLQQNPRLDLVPVDKQVEILPNVWSIGEMKTSYMNIALFEQALILNGARGLYVITGCAHPGIVEIIERVKEVIPERPIALVTGGFHLGNATAEEVRQVSSRLRELGVEAIAPSHCTGGLAMEIFREEWGENYLALYLGDVCKF